MNVFRYYYRLGLGLSRRASSRKHSMITRNDYVRAWDDHLKLFEH